MLKTDIFRASPTALRTQELLGQAAVVLDFSLTSPGLSGLCFTLGQAKLPLITILCKATSVQCSREEAGTAVLLIAGY
jgi:hypothetical protein